MGLTTNAKEILKRMERRPAAVRREMERAAQQLAPVMMGECKRILSLRVYSVPIPLTKGANARLSANARDRKTTTKGRHGKWRREKTLMNSESARADGMDVLMTNNAEHAKARYALGGPPEINKAGRKAGVQQSQEGTSEAERSKTESVQWQAEAVTNKRDTVLQFRRDAVSRGLRSP